MSIKHYRLDFVKAPEPSGVHTTKPRTCCACGTVLCAKGGGGEYICDRCLWVLTTGKLMVEFRATPNDGANR